VIEVSKEFKFDAAHSLPHLPATHKCHHLHGHTYTLVVYVRGEINPAMGWFIDYAEIKSAVDPLLRKLDHKFLNDVVPFFTTAENLAAWIFHELESRIHGLSAIELKETATTSVVYRP